jgi:hypothetical protein
MVLHRGNPTSWISLLAIRSPKKTELARNGMLKESVFISVAEQQVYQAMPIKFSRDIGMLLQVKKAGGIGKVQDKHPLDCGMHGFCRIYG